MKKQKGYIHITWTFYLFVIALISVCAISGWELGNWLWSHITIGWK